MCLATPIQVKKISANYAVVDGNKKIDISLISGLKPGDYILAHANLGINKLEKKEAKKILEIVKNCHHQHAHQH